MFFLQGGSTAIKISGKLGWRPKRALSKENAGAARNHRLGAFEFFQAALCGVSLKGSQTSCIKQMLLPENHW